MANRIRDLPILALLALTMCGGPNPTPAPPDAPPPDPLATWQRIHDEADSYLAYVELALRLIEPGSISPELRERVEEAVAIARPALDAYGAALDLVRAGDGPIDDLEAAALVLIQRLDEVRQAFIRAKAQERRTLEGRPS